MTIYHLYYFNSYANIYGKFSPLKAKNYWNIKRTNANSDFYKILQELFF